MRLGRLSAGSRRTVGDILMVTGAFLAFFNAYLFRGRDLVCEGDFLQEFYPLMLYTARNVLNGILAQWNPYSFCGYPHSALPYAGTFYPFSFLDALGDPRMAVKLELLGHVYLMLVFYYALGRTLFRHRFSAVALAVFPMATSLLARFYAADEGAGGLRLFCWMPLVFLCTCRIVRGGGGKWILGLSLSILLQALVANPQILVYEFMVVGIFTTVELARRRLREGEPWRSIARKIGALVLGVSLAFAGSAVQFAPFYELVAGQSIRSEAISYEFMSSYSLPLAYYASSLSSIDLHFFLTPIVLAFACFGVQYRGKPERWGFFCALLFCLVFAMGKHTPLYRLMYYVPVVNRCRVPGRILYLAAGLMPILAAYGVDGFLGLCHRRRLGFGAFAHLSLVLVFSLFLILHKGAEHAVVESAAIVLAVGGSLALALTRRGVRWAALFVALCLSVELGGLSHYGVKFGMPSAFEIDKDFQAFLDARQDNDRVAFFHSLTTWNTKIAQATGMMTRTRMFGGYFSAPLQHYAEFGAALIESPDALTAMDVARRVEFADFHTSMVGWVRADNVRVLDLLNIRYLVTDGIDLPFPEAESEQEGGRFRKLRVGDLTVYENRLASPMAYTLHKARVYPTTLDALKGLRDPEFEYRETAAFSEPFDAGMLETRKGPEPVRVVAYEPNRVVLDVDMLSAGLLVLSDTYYPGWTAKLDGATEVPVLRVDHMLRGVFVPEGRHRVQLEFRPWSVRGGMICSVITSAVLFLWAVFLMKTRRRRIHPESVGIRHK